MKASRKGGAVDHPGGLEPKFYRQLGLARDGTKTR